MFLVEVLKSLEDVGKEFEVRNETKLFDCFGLENKKGLPIYFTYEDKHVHSNETNVL